ncbi:MAG: hypothetical protein D9V47_00050 [Clostridia bacterium]|nr:MAG: hypothetical protein D9V47_00050 [Clostridia bacterium]
MRKTGKEPFFVFTPQGRKVIGNIEHVGGQKVLVKKIDRQKHFHKNFAAYGLQAEALPRLREAGVQAVRLLVENGEILQASLDDLERYGFLRQFGAFGEQVFLPERYWHQVRPPAGALVQLRLFA